MYPSLVVGSTCCAYVLLSIAVLVIPCCTSGSGVCVSNEFGEALTIQLIMPSKTAQVRRNLMRTVRKKTGTSTILKIGRRRDLPTMTLVQWLLLCRRQRLLLRRHQSRQWTLCLRRWRSWAQTHRCRLRPSHLCRQSRQPPGPNGVPADLLQSRAPGGQWREEVSWCTIQPITVYLRIAMSRGMVSVASIAL